MEDALTLDDARELLNESRVYGLVECLHEAVKTWRGQHFTPAIRETTRAGIISDNFYWNMETLSLAVGEGVVKNTVRGQRFVTFDERALIRCKHLRRGLESRNYGTRQALAFVRQRPIEGFPPIDRLHLGYRLDPFGMALADAFITLPVGNANRFNLWVWQVWGESIESSSTYGQQPPLALPGYDSKLYHYEDYSKRFA